MEELDRLLKEQTDIESELTRYFADRDTLAAELGDAARRWTEFMPRTPDEFDGMENEMRALKRRMAELEQRRIALLQRAERARDDVVLYTTLYYDQ